MKKRYKFNSSLKLKRTHLSMVRNLDAKNVSSNNTKSGDVVIYFTIKGDEVEQSKIVSHFKKIGILLEEM